MAIIRDLLATAPSSALAGQFKGKAIKSIKSIEPVLAAMQVLGPARHDERRWRLV